MIPTNNKGPGPQNSVGAPAKVRRSLVLRGSVTEVLPQQTRKKPSSRVKGAFIRGPIPLDWIHAAAVARATELALYLLYKTGIVGVEAGIQVRPGELSKFGLNDDRRRRQVLRLEEAGLCEVVSRGAGKCPRLKVRMG